MASALPRLLRGLTPGPRYLRGGMGLLLGLLTGLPAGVKREPNLKNLRTSSKAFLRGPKWGLRGISAAARPPSAEQWLLLSLGRATEFSLLRDVEFSVLPLPVSTFST